MGVKNAVESVWRESLEDIGLEVARVAIQNGYPVLLADRRLTRATRYHGLRLPEWEAWWWADEISEILAKLMETNYRSVFVIGVEKNNLVTTWELQICSNRENSTS